MGSEFFLGTGTVKKVSPKYIWNGTKEQGQVPETKPGYDIRNQVWDRDRDKDRKGKKDRNRDRDWDQDWDKDNYL